MKSPHEEHFPLPKSTNRQKHTHKNRDFAIFMGRSDCKTVHIPHRGMQNRRVFEIILPSQLRKPLGGILVALGGGLLVPLDRHGDALSYAAAGLIHNAEALLGGRIALVG